MGLFSYVRSGFQSETHSRIGTDSDGLKVFTVPPGVNGRKKPGRPHLPFTIRPRSWEKRLFHSVLTTRVRTDVDKILFRAESGRVSAQMSA